MNVVVYRADEEGKYDSLPGVCDNDIKRVRNAPYAHDVSPLSSLN